MSARRDQSPVVLRASISIVTVVRNAAGVVGDCLESVRRQALHCEHVLVDGASTDGTRDILAQYAARQTAAGRRVVLISEPDRGLYDAMNKGIAAASGDIVGMLNADDVYAADDVAARVAGALDGPDADACYGDVVFVRGGPGQTGCGDPAATRIVRRWRAGRGGADAFRRGWMPPHPTFFLRRRLYQQHGLYRLDLGTSADYELMLRMFVLHGIRASYLPVTLVCMRAGGLSSRSLANRIAANRNDRRAWAVNGLKPNVWTLWAKPIRKLGQWWPARDRALSRNDSDQAKAGTVQEGNRFGRGK